MTKNRIFLASLVLGALPLTMVAQDDDMYFVSSKKTVERTSSNGMPRSTYYCGSQRDVDEYNRRGQSHYEVISTDTTGNDIIDFSAEKGVYPDSTQATDSILAAGDYALTRKMARYDGYDNYIAYRDGYRDGRYDEWRSSSWYYPWYDSYWYWRDPWFYDPWYPGYYWYRPYGWHVYHYGWHGPYYYGGVRYIGRAGSQNHGRISYNNPRGISNGRSTRYSSGTFGGRSINRGTYNSSTATRSTSSFGGSRSASSSYSRSSSSSSGGSRSFGGSSSSFGGSRSSGGSFGGGRSFGGGGGGSRGGGGSFGGRR